MRFKVLLALIILTTIFTAQTEKIIEVGTLNTPISIDGKLDEVIWSQAQFTGEFQQQFPIDSIEAISKTEVAILADDQNLYVAAKCYDLNKKTPYVVQTLKRDFEPSENDNFAIFIDPFKDKTNGFGFAVTPFGNQMEGAIQFGGTSGASDAWDNKWFSEVSQTEYGWSVEMQIPFKTLRYDASIRNWGVNFCRVNLKENEISVWNSVPVNFGVTTLACAGTMHWNKLPTPAGTNVSLIPYVSGAGSVNYSNNETNLSPGVGMDAKIALSSSLNLDLTINPDFSQVDVDAQVTNLSRFSIFFPERRQFFIENSDLFGRFGFSRIRPFFSRKIGLDQNNQPLTILGGARLSGKINNDWRIGLMNMQTEGAAGRNAENYTVAAVQRTVFKTSNIAAIAVNRQAFEEYDPIKGDYNRLVGLDFNLQSQDGKNRGKLFYHHTFSPSISDYAHASWFMHNEKKFTVHWNHEYVGEDYRADVGFVPRIQNYNSETGDYEYRSYWRLEPSVSYRTFLNHKKINYIQNTLYYSQYYGEKFAPTESFVSFSTTIFNKNRSRYGVEGAFNAVKLLFPTDITFSGNENHEAGFYEFSTIESFYESTPAKTFGYMFNLNYGNFYTGQRFRIIARASFRIQPKFKASIDFTENEIWFSDETFENTRLFLIAPNIQYQFNRKMFFTTFIQYNTQIDNVSINARFQYRFKPMSDLFVVYTDNYDANILGIKNRALVIKLVWWLNM